MSNTNRAVTRARRAARGQLGSQMTARKARFDRVTAPAPFPVVRWQPPRRGRDTAPMTDNHRTIRYLAGPRRDFTPAQARRWRKKHNQARVTATLAGAR